MANFIHKKFKTILNKRKFIDNWFWDRYSVNCYNGCQFGCIYCDTRATKYHMPSDFENTIIVKENVAEMLDKRITNARTLLPDVVGMSACDPYQAAEKKFGNTLQCLEVLEKHKYPVHILTKSNLVLRDLDLLERIARQTWSCVSFTITTLDQKVADFLEPNAPSPIERINALNKIKKQNVIQAGVLLIPIIPFLSDSSENLEQLVKMSKEAGADYILFGGGMTMREQQACYFLKKLKEQFPALIENYEELFQFNYTPDLYSGNYEADKKYTTIIHKKIFALCEKYNIAYRIKRYIPDDYRKNNYIIAEKLLNLAYKQQMLGQKWSNDFWAGMNIQNLKESVEDIAKREQLHTIRNVNQAVTDFIIANLK